MVLLLASFCVWLHHFCPRLAVSMFGEGAHGQPPPLTGQKGSIPARVSREGLERLRGAWSADHIQARAGRQLCSAGKASRLPRHPSIFPPENRDNNRPSSPGWCEDYHERMVEA